MKEILGLIFVVGSMIAFAIAFPFIILFYIGGIGIYLMGDK